jgi:hypothetical protein
MSVALAVCGVNDGIREFRVFFRIGGKMNLMQHTDRSATASKQVPRLPVATPQYDSTVEIGGLAKGNANPSALRDSTQQKRVASSEKWR